MARKGGTYCTKYGRTVKPSLKARENAAVAADHDIVEVESMPEKTYSEHKFTPKSVNPVKSEGEKSRLNYELAKRRLELEHRKRLLELEETELERTIEELSVRSHRKPPSFHQRNVCKNAKNDDIDDVSGNFAHEESIPAEALTREWIKFHNEFMPSDEHTRPKSVANDWIDSIGTVVEQNAIQRNAMHFPKYAKHCCTSDVVWLARVYDRRVYR